MTATVWAHKLKSAHIPLQLLDYIVKKNDYYKLKFTFFNFISFPQEWFIWVFFKSTSNAQLTEELFEQPKYADKNKNALNLYCICTQFYFLFCYWMMI